MIPRALAFPGKGEGTPKKPLLVCHVLGERAPGSLGLEMIPFPASSEHPLPPILLLPERPPLQDKDLADQALTLALL